MTLACLDVAADLSCAIRTFWFVIDRRIEDESVHWLFEFFTPYLKICHIAAWGIAQNLEGIGLFGYLNNYYVSGVPYPVWNLSPTQGVTLVSLVYTALLLFLFLVNIRAAFYLGKGYGYAALSAWLIPGVLTIAGVSFDVATLGPDKFEYGQGFPGNLGSAVINLLLFMILGWSVITLIGAWFHREKFKHAYDHIWYPLALMAAVYFVVDAGFDSYQRDFKHSDEKITQYLNLYSTSAASAVAACEKSPSLFQQAEHLCTTLGGLQSEIKVDLEFSGELRARSQLSRWVTLLAGGKDEALSREINIANMWACDQGHLRENCTRIPMDAALKTADLDTTYLFPPNDYAVAIEKHQLALVKADSKIREVQQSRNYRYFAFLGVAFLAGGKVSNSTRSLSRNGEEKPISWLLLLFRKLLSASVQLGGWALSWIAKIIQPFRQP